MTCCFLVVDLVVWVTMVAVLKRIVAAVFVVILVVYVLCGLVVLVFVGVAFLVVLTVGLVLSALVFVVLLGCVGYDFWLFGLVFIDCVNSIGYGSSLVFLLVLCFKFGLLGFVTGWLTVYLVALDLCVIYLFLCALGVWVELV